MAESPSGYFPDFFLQYDTKGFQDFATEVLTSRSGREQRRSLTYPALGYRRFTASSRDLTQANRQTLRAFMVTQKGKFGAFYFWNPFGESLQNFAAGSVSASSTFIVPIKGMWYGNEGQTPVTATYTTVTVAGVGVAFTVAANIGGGGEDQITFTGGAQTGAVVVNCTNARERITSRLDMDSYSFSILQSAADVRELFTIAIKEVA